MYLFVYLFVYLFNLFIYFTYLFIYLFILSYFILFILFYLFYYFIYLINCEVYRKEQIKIRGKSREKIERKYDQISQILKRSVTYKFI